MNGKSLQYITSLEKPESDLPYSPILSQDVVCRLNRGLPINDEEFDRIFPQKVRACSEVHWSPVLVAMHIADFTNDLGRIRFLDIGSGPGKLCSLLSLMTKMQVFGIEQRRDLYSVAKSLATRNNFLVHYLHGNMLDLDWNDYDIIYLYNPFQEHLCESGPGVIDNNIELDRKFYFQYVEDVFSRFLELRPGKRVITYHGYGGRFPVSMRLVRSRLIGMGQLCMWEKMNRLEMIGTLSSLQPAESGA